jgi:hypothetical protein
MEDTEVRENGAHTPTPWKTGTKYPTRVIGGNSDTSMIVAGTALPVDEGSPNETEIANAAFIVRACNSHEALVRELRNLVDFINQYGIRDANGKSLMEDLGYLQEAEAALAAAEAA